MSTTNAYTPRENFRPYRAIPPLELMKVAHSQVAAFGWLEEMQVLFIRLKNGGGELWAIPGFTLGMYDALMVSTSQGKKLYELWDSGPRILIASTAL